MAGKIGIHSLVFTDDWSEATARRACETAARIGYELIEVLIFDPATLDRGMTKRVVGETGLELRLGMALAPNTDISSPDPAVAKAGEETVGRCLEIASDLGVPAISGIVYAAFNAYQAPPSSGQRRQVADALGRLDRRAAELGVKIGIEPVNRYESYLINTVDQAGDLIAEAGGANCFIHMDTFHMAMEESDLAAALMRHRDRLGYAHLAENNRGLPGTGMFDFRRYFRTLAAVGYRGDFTVETFSPACLGAGIVGAISLWRSPWRDPEAAAKSAYDFVRTEMVAAASSVAPW